MKYNILITQIIWLLVITFTGLQLKAQSINKADKAAISSIMDKQEKCWNAGDLDCFMEGYWKSESLKFIGKSGLNFGWQTTLDNYKKSYPDKATMGQLQFGLLSMEAIGQDHALVIGSWHLKREEKEDIGGHFSLVWKKIDGHWVIISDHSS